MSRSKKATRKAKRGSSSTYEIGAGYSPVSKVAEGHAQKPRSTKIKTLKPLLSPKNAGKSASNKGSSVTSEKKWIEENGY